MSVQPAFMLQHGAHCTSVANTLLYFAQYLWSSACRLHYLCCLCICLLCVQAFSLRNYASDSNFAASSTLWAFWKAASCSTQKPQLQYRLVLLLQHAPSNESLIVSFAIFLIGQHIGCLKRHDVSGHLCMGIDMHCLPYMHHP